MKSPKRPPDEENQAAVAAPSLFIIHGHHGVTGNDLTLYIHTSCVFADAASRWSVP
jgi:hypothetical protein